MLEKLNHYSTVFWQAVVNYPRVSYLILLMVVGAAILKGCG